MKSNEIMHACMRNDQSKRFSRLNPDFHSAENRKMSRDRLFTDFAFLFK